MGERRETMVEADLAFSAAKARLLAGVFRLMGIPRAAEAQVRRALDLEHQRALIADELNRLANPPASDDPRTETGDG